MVLGVEEDNFLSDSNALGAISSDVWTRTGGQIFFVTGVPTVTISATRVAPSGTGAGPANNGDIAIRIDGGAGTTIYQARAGAWVATAA